ncbi:MAG: VIT1/CCC1 transporter family protein [Rhodospirillales bacterium]
MSAASADRETVARWREEMTAAWLYRVLAAAEADPAKAELFRRLSASAEEQAGIIAGPAGAPSGFHPTLRARLVAIAARALTPRRARALLTALKVRGMSVYDGPAEGHRMPVTVAEIGRSHRGATGGTLRAAVFGANDGLVSNTCLILGIAGAEARPSVLVLTGVAGLLAGAFSMASGEYVSVRSQREMYEHQIALERAELAQYPAEEAEELALIYSARGVPIDEARSLSRRLSENPAQMLNTLAREELGLNPDDLGSPLGAALSSFFAFAVGAAVPLLPLVLLGDAVLAAAAVSALALFAVGALLSLFSGRGAVAGGARMLAIGGAAAAATYGAGHLLGVALT